MDYKFIFGGLIVVLLLLLIFVFIVLQLKKKEASKKNIVEKPVVENDALKQPEIPTTPPVVEEPMEDPKIVGLRQYLTSQLAKGIDRETLTSALRAKGWNPEDIDKAFKGL